MEKRTRANLSDLSHCRLNDTFELNESFMADMSAMGCNCSVLQHFNREEMESLHCGPFPFVHPLLIQIGYVLLFSALILLAVGGNLTVIWIVLRHKRMRTVTNYFLLNLAIADASISVFNLGFSWTFNLYYVWIFGYAYCVFNNFMGIVPTCASVFTMVVMSCDRYVAIVHPLRKRLSKKKTISIIVLIWVLALTCGVPMLLYSKLDKLYFYSEADGSVYVDPICLSDNYPDGKAHTSYLFAVYNNFLVIINYALPLVVLLVAYARVACALWSSETIGDTRHQDSINSKRRVVKMLAAVVFIFMICWAPYNLYFTVLIRVLNTETDQRTALYIYLNMYWLAMSSTVFNPFIYCWLNARFRTGFKYVFRWLPCVHMTKYEYLHSQLFDCPQRGSRGTTLTSHGAMTNGRGSGRRSIPRHAFDNNNHIRTERTLSAAAVEHPLVNAVSFDDDSSRM